MPRWLQSTGVMLEVGEVLTKKSGRKGQSSICSASTLAWLPYRCLVANSVCSAGWLFPPHPCCLAMFGPHLWCMCNVTCGVCVMWPAAMLPDLIPSNKSGPLSLLTKLPQLTADKQVLSGWQLCRKGPHLPKPQVREHNPPFRLQHGICLINILLHGAANCRLTQTALATSRYPDCPSTIDIRVQGSASGKASCSA